MLPTLQFVFNGPLCVDAPADMFAGIGKNGQLVSVAPSKGMVVVRMGNAPSGPGSEVSTVLLNQIWQHLNGIMCNSTAIHAPERPDGLSVSHATAQQEIIIQNTNQLSYHCAVTDLAGRILLQKKSNQSETLQVHTLSNGVYFLSLRCENGQTLLHKFVIQH
jgi:Secretion system C-terminal sorting domain